jgi:hypothetical protein
MDFQWYYSRYLILEELEWAQVLGLARALALVSITHTRTSEPGLWKNYNLEKNVLG